MSERLNVAVIGGGVAGISAVKACLEEGLEPTCFEQHDQIGKLFTIYQINVGDNIEYTKVIYVYIFFVQSHISAQATAHVASCR